MMHFLSRKKVGTCDTATCRVFPIGIRVANRPRRQVSDSEVQQCRRFCPLNVMALLEGRRVWRKWIDADGPSSALPRDQCPFLQAV